LKYKTHTVVDTEKKRIDVFIKYLNVGLIFTLVRNEKVKYHP